MGDWACAAAAAAAAAVSSSTRFHSFSEGLERNYWARELLVVLSERGKW